MVWIICPATFVYLLKFSRTCLVKRQHFLKCAHWWEGGALFLPCRELTHQNWCIKFGRIHYTWLVETEIASSARRVTFYSTTAKEIARHHELYFSGTNSSVGQVYWRFHEILWSDLSSDRKINYFRTRRIRWCGSYFLQNVFTCWNWAARVLSNANIF